MPPLTMLWLWGTLEVWKIKTETSLWVQVRMVLTWMMTSLPQKLTRGRVLPTLVWVSGWEWLPHVLRHWRCSSKLAHKEFHKKVWASCSPAKLGFWKNTQLEQIRSNHNTVWGSNYKVMKTEQDLTFDKDPSSFKMSRMAVCTDQLLLIKAATNMSKRVLVWSLKQFCTHFYWLCQKGITHTMMCLQGLHLCNTLKCLSISGGIGLKSFCPWCLKLGGNMEMIAATSV